MRTRSGSPSWRRQAALFARNFFRHPRMLGSVIPSSRFLTARLLRQIDWGRATVIVEYGPGVGTLTREILRHMRSDAVLIAIEMNPEFVDFLRESIPDERLHVVQGSAAGVTAALETRGLSGADYIVSGIPFSTISDAERERILMRTRDALRPGGRLLIYQFSARVLPDLQRIFSEVTRSFEPLNVLPAQVFVAQ